MNKDEILATLEGVPTKKEGRSQVDEAQKISMFEALSLKFEIPVECFDVRAISEPNATTRSMYETTGRRLVASKGRALPEWIFLGRVGVEEAQLESIAISMKSQLDGACSIAILFAKKLGWNAYRIFYADGRETLASKFATFFGVNSSQLEAIGEIVPTGRHKPNILLQSVRGQNIIFFGPPGTGKSTEVDKRAGPSPIRTQFHPEYSHADLIGSYRPVVGFESDPADKVVGHDGGVITRPVNYFAFVPGPLTLALEYAFGTSDHVFLVIEEINRGDCAAIFGDAFQLLDRNDAGHSQFGITPKPELIAYFKAKGVNYDIAGDGKLYLPPNLSLLATMNTSDQSLYPMDSAFKRRWDWVACLIDLQQLLAYTGGTRPFLDDKKEKWDWIKLLELMNKNIVHDSMEDKQIGPWFIKPAKNGMVPLDAFLNKCLFYLWHDVFKDQQSADESPFITDIYKTFGEVQANIRDNGLAAGFKPRLLTPIAAAVEPVTSEAPQAPEAPQAAN